MATDLTVAYVVTAPASSDGYGGIAVLNSPIADTNFVGYLEDFSRNVVVRPSKDNVVEGHGSNFGAFYDGEMTISLKVKLQPSSTYALSNARHDKLLRATSALADYGTIVWTENGGVAKRILFKVEQKPTDPDEQGYVLVGLSSPDDRIYANAATTGGAGTCTNAGDASTPPTFTLTAPTNTITLTNSTTSKTVTLTGLSGAETVTVNFKDRTVTATSGAANRYSAVSYPSSVWWDLIPGANTVAVSGATVSGSGISWRAAWP